jgi:hypothetical protein
MIEGGEILGQAKLRGSFEDRKQAAIKRDKGLLVEKMGGRINI